MSSKTIDTEAIYESPSGVWARVDHVEGDMIHLEMIEDGEEAETAKVCMSTQKFISTFSVVINLEDNEDFGDDEDFDGFEDDYNPEDHGDFSDDIYYSDRSFDSIMDEG